MAELREGANEAFTVIGIAFYSDGIVVLGYKSVAVKWCWVEMKSQLRLRLRSWRDAGRQRGDKPSSESPMAGDSTPYQECALSLPFALTTFYRYELASWILTEQSGSLFNSSIVCSDTLFYYQLDFLQRFQYIKPELI